MTAKLSSHEAGTGTLGVLREAFREAPRYFIASLFALALDAGIYVALIRVFDVHYLVAAPAGYAIGVLVIYLLSTKWVFASRRLRSAQQEFLIFVLVGFVGLLANQAIIYTCVEQLSTSYELAKLVSACAVFGINFGGRKLLLFTRF
jgi:putative flippase GtrA